MNVSLNFRFIVAFTALVLLTLLNYSVQTYHTQTVDGDASILNQAGRQRMLATRVAYLSSQLVIHGGETEMSGKICQQLLQAAKQMEDEHTLLVHGSPEFISDPAVWQAFYEAPAMLDQQFHSYIAAARLMAQNPDHALGHDDPLFERVGSLAAPLVDAMNRVVEQYEASAARRIRKLHLLEMAGVLIQFAGLFATWLVIFRPMARRVIQYSGAQTRVNAELVRSNTALAAQKEELEREKQLTDDLRQRLQAILDAAGEGITGLDLDGRIIFTNAAAAHLLGYSPESLLGAGHHDLLHHSHQDGSPYPAGQCRIDEAIREERSFRSEGEIFWRADGTAMPVDVVSMPLHEHGVLIGAVLVFGDISERKAAEAAVQRVLCELERSNRELDDFAYIASHDLKEPLRGIHNYAGFLLEDYGNRLDEEGRRYLETLQRLSLRMENLVDTLLHYSRLGRTDLNRETCDLNGVLAEALDSLGNLVRAPGVEVQVAKSLPSIACNRVMACELLHNLIVNAVKYNDSSIKKIEIGFVPNHRETVFYVRDNGIGIPEKHQELIFRIFKRLHGRDKYGGGTGAGLTIVKKIVERHGGRVWVESTPGEGSTFYFTLENGSGDEHQTESADSGR